jgi:hypothetical protein
MAKSESEPLRPKLLNEFLATALEWAQGQGNKTALANLMTEHAGKRVTRQMVGRWLHPDPVQRLEPNLGHGLLLAHCVGILQQQKPAA